MEGGDPSSVTAKPRGDTPQRGGDLQDFEPNKEFL